MSSVDPAHTQAQPLNQTGFDATLASLEKTISLLADGSAPLDELVAAHQRAAALLTDAEQRLEALKARAEQLARQLAE